MNIPWKIYLAKFKRTYSSIFEERNIDIIRQDYYNNLWISKAELSKLFKYETAELANTAINAQNEYKDLLSGFNLNAMQNYEILEKKFQGRSKL